MKHLLLLILTFTSLNVIHAQPKFIFNNDSLKYHIVAFSHKTSIGLYMDYPGNYIYVRFSDNEKNYLKQLTYNQWMTFLEDTSTDWAANLILCSLAYRDASVYIGVKLKEWRSRMKLQDIKYWRAYLADSLNSRLIFPPAKDSLIQKTMDNQYRWDSIHKLW